MKIVKNILVIAIITIIPSSAFSQWFIEGGVGFSMLNTSSGYNSVKNAKGLNFQIGKFVSEYKMRSFTFGFDLSPTNLIDDKFRVYQYDPVSQQTVYALLKRTTSVSVTYFGYERRITFANTEFDDPWVIYWPLSYHFSIIKFKDEIDDAAWKQKFLNNQAGEQPLNSTEIDLDITTGVGVSRKFSVNTYAYTDFRLILPFVVQDYRSLFRLQFGVRHML